MAPPAKALLFAAAAFPVAHAQSAADFLGRYLLAESGEQCVGNGRPCEAGVDCCGVCAYIGADTWTCVACTEVGDECIPMGNRCCDGGAKRKDAAVPEAQHSCQATSEVSEKYGITKYTCQARNASSVAMDSAELASGSARAVELREGSMVESGISANIRHRGDATAEQSQDLRDFAYECFSRHAIDISNLGELQGSLGRATGCVVDRCEAKWGWKPVVTQSGSDNGGPYDVYGRGATVVGVEAPSGRWEFMLRLKN